MWKKVIVLVSFFVLAYSVNENLRSQSIIYGISSLANGTESKSLCYKQLSNLFNATESHKVWALKVVDACGHPEPGFIYGNNLWIGSHSQCRDISNRKKFEISSEKNLHDPPTEYDYPPYQLKFIKAFLQHNNTLQHHTQLPLEFTIQLGLCVPELCSNEEVKTLLGSYFKMKYLSLQKLYGIHLNVTKVKSLQDDGTWMLKLPKTIALITISAIVVLLSIIGTTYDVKKHNKEKNLVRGHNGTLNSKETDNKVGVSTAELITNSNLSLNSNHSVWGKILKSFSIYSFTKVLVKTRLPTDSIPCIHGIRFFGMLWVIMAHTVFYQADYLANVPFAYRLSEDLFSQILSNSTYCVDTYLFLSGFLVAYLFYKSKETKNSTQSVNYVKSFMEFGMMVINRIMRLTPPYLVVILFSDVMYTYYRQTSALESSEKPDELCGKYWWRNILYINNLFPRSEMCLSWSWYLALDTQFYVTTVLLLTISTFAFKTAATILFGLILVNIFATTYKSYSIGYIPTMDEQLGQLDAIYDLPWNRIGPYLVGVLTGYILLIKLKRKLRLKERTRIILWTTLPFINLWILFTLYTRNLSVEFSAIYMGISRTLWGVGLAWMIIACCTGNARALEKFLSFSGWIPLSRLTYCAYLLNPLVANMVFLGSESSLNASLASFSLTVLGNTMMTFYIAFIFSMLFESPFILLTKMAFKNLSRKEPKREKEGETQAT